MIALGSSDMAKAYVGSTEVSKIYLGSEQVYTKEVLPYDAEVEYLQSSNTGAGNTRQTILLGISGDAQFEVTAQSTVTSSSSQVLLGGTTGGKVATWFGVLPNGKWGAGTSSGQYVDIDGTTKATANLTFSSKTVSGAVNGLSFSRTGSDNFSNWALFTTDNGSYGFTGRVYACKAYKNGSLVLDLIPVRVGQVGYMYNKVNGNLLGNSRYGSFTIGPDV